MKYQAPPGGESNASYIDGNRAAGVKGSIVPAKAVEQGQRELNHLIDYSGQIPSDDDLEQVRKAIEAMIDAAIGGGGSEGYLLLSQARARLPIFPEVQNADARIVVTSPGTGQVLVPSTVAILHRGIFPLNTSDYTTEQRTFATAANKVYHLRWTPGDGFVLKDTADGTYNALALAETNAAFDTKYDDMLVARVVTNSGNAPTITNLANRDRLSAQYTKTTYEQGSAVWAPLPKLSVPLNWARRPRVSISQVTGHITGLWETITQIGHGTYNGDGFGQLDTAGMSRYGGEAWVLGYIFNPSVPTQPANGWGSYPFVLEAWA